MKGWIINIDWGALGGHICGSPESIPAKLRALASEDKKVREAAVDFLFALGDEQREGELSETTPYIIPFAISIIRERPSSAYEALLGLFNTAAHLRARGFTRNWLDHKRLQIHAYDALVQGIPVYVASLQNEEIDFRRLSALLLGELTGAPALVVEPLIAHFAVEQDERVQNVVLDALANVFCEINQEEYTGLKITMTTFLLSIIEDAERSLQTRAIATRAIVRCSLQYPFTFPVDPVVRSRLNSVMGDVLVNDFFHRLSKNMYDPTMWDDLELLTKGGLKPLFQLLTNSSVNAFGAHLIGRVLLGEVFGRGTQVPRLHPIFMPPEEYLLREWKDGRFYTYSRKYRIPLTGDQQKVIEAITSADVFWELPTNLFSFFHGLPDLREELRQLIQES